MKIVPIAMQLSVNHDTCQMIADTQRRHSLIDIWGPLHTQLCKYSELDASWFVYVDFSRNLQLCDDYKEVQGHRSFIINLLWLSV